jgi:putative transposase
VFEALRQERGLPQALRTDNGPEFLGWKAFINWAKAAGMAIQYVQPGKPNQNAYIERFNRTLREELLDANLLMRLDDVREAVCRWQLVYNERGPHAALGDIPPSANRIKSA